MKKTKIICSIGPASNDVDILTDMAIHGMNVARINFSHGDYEEKDKFLENIVKVRENTGKQVGILWDTRGPEFRTGKFENDKIDLVPGENIKIVKDEVIGNKDRFSVNHSEALNNIEVGNTILIDNGKMKLSVIDKDEKSVTCNVIAGGELSNNKSINVPGVSLTYVSREDKKDIEYACRNDGEFLAISFVNSKNDVLEIRKILLEYDRPDIKIISKIESSIAIDNIDEILEVSDGVMIARGDLGTEIPSEKLPIVQKQIIKKARKLRKIAIVATEMLESMT